MAPGYFKILNPPAMKTLKERFEDKVFYSPDGCWYWLGQLRTGGYGRVSHGRRKSEGAHRVSYRLFVGEIPDGLQVCHSCDNRLCVNPKHLWLGTHLQNHEDKGRKCRGGNNNKKLSIAQVIELKSQLPNSRIADLARRYSVDEKTIRRIRDGLSFKYV